MAEIKVGDRFWSSPTLDDELYYKRRHQALPERFWWTVTRITAKQFVAQADGAKWERRFWKRNLREVSSDTWHRVHLNEVEEARDAD